MNQDLLAEDALLVDPISAETLEELRTHFQNYPEFGEDPPNQAMLTRLEGGERTSVDLRFYEHEMLEADVLNRGVINPDMDLENQRRRDAHLWTLGRQNIRYEAGCEAQLYHREVIEQFPDSFSDEARAIAIGLQGS